MIHVIADLACEYWKLLHNYDRLIAAAPEFERPALLAQVRYGERRLQGILRAENLALLSFDGQTYSVNLPVIAINADEFNHDEVLFIENTIEPAVIHNMKAIRQAKVYIARRTTREE